MASNPFASLEWRSIGPHRGGRVVAVAGHPIERGTFFFGGCAGGVWKTTNGGSHWENISDGFFKTAAVGALTVSTSDPNVIYAGMGETSIRSNVSHGDGVYKSEDGGATWRNVGLAPTRHIGRIIVHPKNPDIVWVAALGHAWGDNAERGVYKSTDGGATWRLVLHKSARAGAIEMTMDPNMPNILYAAIWQGRRYPYACVSGGPDSGLWKSVDGGETWTEITGNKGLPTGTIGKIGLAASPARAGRIWALVEAEEGGVFRSDDYGATWQKLNGDMDLRRRPWYYMHIFADPSDANTVYDCNLNFWKSTDGGKNWEIIPTPHGDNHALWIDPRDSARMVQGNDGGANVTYDGGRTWSSILNQPTAQFYHVITDKQVPYNVYGSQQDNWAMRLPSIGWEGAISWKDYVEPGGGESGYIAISPKPPHRVYGGGIGTGLGHGRLLSWNPETRQARNVTVWPEVHGMGAGAEAMKYRFQWTFPIEFSPHNPDAVYVCSNLIHRSTDEATTWEVISPDLTRNDPEKIHSSGGEITSDNSGAEIYCTIFAFIESPHEAGVYWTGSDDGLVHVSRDNGKSWQNVTPPTLPEWARIHIIEASPFDKATVYVAASNYQNDDNRPFLFKTADYGQTWSEMTAGIRADDFTRTIRADPNCQGVLYAGTETGVYVSLDDGANWQWLETNLPVVPIWDLTLNGTDLVAGTHGRSFWILDDVTPLHQLARAQAAGQTRLFKPRDTVRFRLYGRAFGRKLTTHANYKMTGPITVSYTSRETPQGTMTEDYLDAGKNPPAGAIIHYYLADKPEGEITLRFLDADGNEIRAFSSATKEGQRVPAAAGANRFVWDLRYEKPTPYDDGKPKDPFAQMMEDALAPRAIPGTYTVELKVGEQTYSETFTIVKDPRVGTAEGLRAQFDLKLAIRDRMTEVNEGLTRIRQIKEGIDFLEERAKAGGDNKAIAEAAEALEKELGAIESTLMNTTTDKPKPGPNQLREKFAALSGMIDESDDPPTSAAQEVYTLLKEQAEEQLTRLHHLQSEDIATLNRLARSGNIPAVVVG